MNLGNGSVPLPRSRSSRRSRNRRRHPDHKKAVLALKDTHKSNSHHHKHRSQVSQRHHDSRSSRSVSRSRRSRKHKSRSRTRNDRQRYTQIDDHQTSNIRFILNDNMTSSSARNLIQEQKDEEHHHYGDYHDPRDRTRQRPRSAIGHGDLQQNVDPTRLHCELNESVVLHIMSSRSPSISDSRHRRPRASTEPSLQELIDPLDDSVFPCSKARWVPDKRADQCMRCHREFERSIFFISGKVYDYLLVG